MKRLRVATASILIYRIHVLQSPQARGRLQFFFSDVVSGNIGNCMPYDGNFSIIPNRVGCHVRQNATENDASVASAHSPQFVSQLLAARPQLTAHSQLETKSSATDPQRAPLHLIGKHLRARACASLCHCFGPTHSDSSKKCRDTLLRAVGCLAHNIFRAHEKTCSYAVQHHVIALGMQMAPMSTKCRDILLFVIGCLAHSIFRAHKKTCSQAMQYRVLALAVQMVPMLL